MNYEDRITLARTFHQQLGARNWDGMRQLLTADAYWVLPGDNAISGRAEGPDGVVERARLIASYGLDFKLEQILVSRDNVALALHNTAQDGNRILDEHLATIFKVEAGKISAIETYLSDLPGMNAFFSKVSATAPGNEADDRTA